MTTSVAIAANRLTEARKANPRSPEHISAIIDLIDQLHQPGGLDALTKVLPNGTGKTEKGV